MSSQNWKVANPAATVQFYRALGVQIGEPDEWDPVYALIFDNTGVQL